MPGADGRDRESENRETQTADGSKYASFKRTKTAKSRSIRVTGDPFGKTDDVTRGFYTRRTYAALKPNRTIAISQMSVSSLRVCVSVDRLIKLRSLSNRMCVVYVLRTGRCILHLNFLNFVTAKFILSEQDDVLSKFSDSFFQTFFCTCLFFFF